MNAKETKRIALLIEEGKRKQEKFRQLRESPSTRESHKPKKAKKSKKAKLEDLEAKWRNQIPYAQYLLTDYWKRVRSKAVETAGSRCNDCKRGNCRLDVHHKTYAHRGAELQFMGDLVVLCRECHLKRHGLI